MADTTNNSGVANPNGQGSLPIQNPNAASQGISSPISVDTLGQSTKAPPTLPNPPTPTPVDITGGHAAITGNQSSLASPPIPAVDPATATPSWYQNMMSLIKPAPSTDAYTKDNNSANITGLQTKANSDQQAVLDAQTNLDNLNAQLKVYSDKAQSIPIQDQQNAAGKGITTAGNAPLDSAALRNNALAAIPLQAQVLAAQAKVASAQGNATLSQNILTQAQNQVDKLFQIQTTDAQNQYNYQKSIIDTYYQYATTQQQAALDAKKTQAANDFTTQQNAMNQAQTLANNAIASGQSSIAGEILALDPKSSTYQADVAKLAGQISPSNKYQISNTTDAFGNPISRVFDSTTGKFVSGGATTNTTATNGVPIIGSGGVGTGTNASGQKLSFDQYGLLANTDFSPTNMVDQLSQKYLDQYIKNGTVPTASSLGRNMKPEAMAQVDSRARDLYFKATGNALPSPQIIKGYQDLINSNNKLANNLSIQEQTVRNNVDLSIANMKANDLNSSNFQPLNNFIDNVGTMFSDPHIGQLIAQNSTIQNELGSLLAVKNASGTTVFDKMASAGIISKNDPQTVITSKVNALMQEATNFAGSLANANADIYKQVDPFLQDPNNPARAAMKVESALNKTGTNYNDVISKTPAGQIPVLDNNGSVGYITPAEFNSQYYTKL